MIFIQSLFMFEMFSYKSFFPFPPSLPYASHRLYVEDAQCDIPQDHFKASVLAACTLALTEQILQHEKKTTPANRINTAKALKTQQKCFGETIR